VPIFKSENITNSREWFYWPTWNTSNSEAFRLLANCNLTMGINRGDEKRWKVGLAESHPGVTCNHVSDAMVEQDSVYTFFGLFHRKIVTVTERLIESGILEFFNDNLKHLKNLYWTSRVERLEHHETKERPFVVSDWKILSIFSAWATLLALAIIAFAFEEVHQKNYGTYLKALFNVIVIKIIFYN